MSEIVRPVGRPVANPKVGRRKKSFGFAASEVELTKYHLAAQIALVEKGDRAKASDWARDLLNAEADRVCADSGANPADSHETSDDS